MKFSFMVLFFILPVLSPLLESLTLPWCKKQLAINQQTWNNFPPECEISIICQEFITVQASNGPATTSALSRLIYICLQLFGSLADTCLSIRRKVGGGECES